MKRAYVQYLDSYGEWQATERMDRDTAEVLADAMPDHMEAFVVVCN